MSHPTTAVILGAGFGSRLAPLTDDRPKCAVTLAGEPLSVRMLRQLGERGVRHGVVVVGHMADRARELIGARIGDVAVEYVENRDFAKTGTMYSTLVGIPALSAGGYLIEGDISASEGVIDRLTGADPALTHWAVDPWSSKHDGSQLKADEGGRIVGQAYLRQKTPGPVPGAWKSAGMLKLSPNGAAVMHEYLKKEADAGNRNVYYDDIVAKHIGAFDIRVLDMTPHVWVEIDNLDDMAEARANFEKK